MHLMPEPMLVYLHLLLESLGVWLNVLLISSLGLRMDDDTIQVAFSLISEAVYIFNSNLY